MCGIIAFIGSKYCQNIIINGLKQLQNRGYDSAGICLYQDTFYIKKFVSSDNSAINQLEKLENKQYEIGIGHTRWATHGGITENNCHPHISNNKNICIVHNGIIENFQEIKNFLIEKKFTFYSDTDTEVIANLISYYRENNNMITTLKKITHLMNGTWGLVILEKGCDKVYFTRKGSPLLLGINNENNYAIITSETSGFSNLITQYFSIKENDICYIEKKENIIFFSEKSLLTFDDSYIQYHSALNLDKDFIKDYQFTLDKEINLYSQKLYQKIENCNLNNDKGPGEFIYWTLKEIEEQKDSSLRAIGMGGRINKGIKLGGLDEYKNILCNIDNLILLGCGTSFNAGLYSSYYFKKINFNTVQVIDGADFSYLDIPKIGKTACIFLSQSGETLDLIRCLEICDKHNVIKIGVINTVDSVIARETDCGCYLNAGREVGVASTKAFTSQIIVLLLINIWFYKHKNNNYSEEFENIIKEFKNISFNIGKILNDSREYMKTWSSKLLKHKSIFILGKDECYSISREASLKIKEISYIHSESYPASSLKHGPFGLLEKGFPVILIDIGEKNRLKMRNVYNEIKCREAEIYTITDKEYENRENVFYIQTKSELNNLFSIIPLQFLSFYLSINKNINPDYPRNLAKVVTVE